MLRVVTGPFHPDLEDALIADLRRLKSDEPLAPLAIVVPSETLRRRLMWLLCVEHGCALLGVHVLTFYQLAVHVLDEAGRFDESGLRPHFFFQELIHQLLRRHPGAAGQWADMAEMPGAWTALLATLNDLKDAKVDPDQAREVLMQSAIGLSAGMEGLLSLYRGFVDEKARMQVFDADDLAAAAEPFVVTSTWLSRRRHILYYGFYDLTQVQLDFFSSISRTVPTTLFFPLVKDRPAYQFARRFFERHLIGRTATDSNGSVPDGGQRSTGPRATCRVLSAATPADEVTVVAKDIVSLAEERGYGFHEMAVVARTLSGYETLVPVIFEQHAIPFASSVSRPLATFPLIKTLLQLLDLRINGYRRDQVITLLGSPFLRRDRMSPEQRGRLDLWDVATRRLGIVTGLDQWRRLTRYIDHGLPLREEDDEGRGPCVPGREIGRLWDVLSLLVASLDEVPETGTWERYVDQVRRLCEQWLDCQPATQLSSEHDPTSSIAACLEGTLEELKRLHAIQPEVTLADFLLALHRAVEQTPVPLGSARANGVQVLDAMAARGLSFRAVYVLGLNEKVFPRHIHEDAFLRDPVRRTLEVDLGCKIQEKLGGYDEEQLLFTLLCESAREQLIVSYQRADEAGRSLVPSGYLVQLMQERGLTAQHLPRRPTGKFETSPLYQTDRLTAAELAVKYLLARRLPQPLLACHPAGVIVARGVTAVGRLEGAGHHLGAYDGLTGPLPACWARLTAEGVSASALQEYAKCPFRYFAKHVLRLRPLSMPEGVDQLEALDLGILAHAILRRVFETLKARGYFPPSVADCRPPSDTPDRQPAVDAIEVLDEAVQHECARFADTHPIGYPLTWRLHQEELRAFLRDVIREDLAEMAREGWQPMFFEKKATGRLDVPIDSETPQPLPVTGRLDRVDWCRARAAYRIVDYKYKGTCAPETLDRNLALGAVRATRLQPPLYLTMGEDLIASLSDGAADARCDGVWFYYLAPRWEPPFTRVAFPGDAWQSALRAPMMQALAHVLSGIRAGRFFLYASGACESCDYRLLCRRTHQPTLWRVRGDHAVVAGYRRLRTATVPKGAAADPASPADEAARDDLDGDADR